MLSDFEFELHRQISGLRALQDVGELASIGDRFIGTEGDKSAAEFMKKRFKSCGLEIRETPFRALSFVEEKTSLKILASGEELAAAAPYFSPSTPPGGIEAELVQIGKGTEAEYRETRVRNKIVVLVEETLGYSRFWLGTFADRAARAGAVGMVLVHPMPWPYRASMEAGNSDLKNRFCKKQLPAVCVSALGGFKIANALGKGTARVRLEVKTAMEERDSFIISAFHRGTENSLQRVGILAHRDNGISPGANDNASGSAVMLEIARALSRTKPRSSIEFISTTAEEGSTPGAHAYCETHKKDLAENMKALIDLDMLSGVGTVKQIEMGHWPDAKPIEHPEWLLALVDEVASEFGYGFGRMTASWGIPEEGRFLNIGVPATCLWGSDDPYYHSIHDSPDKVNPNNLKAASDTIAVAAWRLANR